MDCINSDGTLSKETQYLLGVLEDPMTAEEISYEMNISLHRAKAIMKELIDMKLVRCTDNAYQLDSEGVKKLIELA